MDIENNLENYLLDLGNLKTGTLNIGGSNFFSSWVLPSLIADFFPKNFPNIQISLVEESSANLSLLLQAGKLDLMIDNCILDEQIFDHYVYQKDIFYLPFPKCYSVNTRLQEYQIPIETIHDGSFLSPEVLSVPLNSFANESFIILRSDNDTGKRALTIFARKTTLLRIQFFD